MAEKPRFSRESAEKNDKNLGKSNDLKKKLKNFFYIKKNFFFKFFSKIKFIFYAHSALKTDQCGTIYYMKIDFRLEKKLGNSRKTWENRNESGKK